MITSKLYTRHLRIRIKKNGQFTKGQYLDWALINIILKNKIILMQNATILKSLEDSVFIMFPSWQRANIRMCRQQSG